MGDRAYRVATAAAEAAYEAAVDAAWAGFDDEDEDAYAEVERLLHAAEAERGVAVAAAQTAWETAYTETQDAFAEAVAAAGRVHAGRVAKAERERDEALRATDEVFETERFDAAVVWLIEKWFADKEHARALTAAADAYTDAVLAADGAWLASKNSAYMAFDAAVTEASLAWLSDVAGAAAPVNTGGDPAWTPGRTLAPTAAGGAAAFAELRVGGVEVYGGVTAPPGVIYDPGKVNGGFAVVLLGQSSAPLDDPGEELTRLRDELGEDVTVIVARYSDYEAVRLTLHAATYGTIRDPAYSHKSGIVVIGHSAGADAAVNLVEEIWNSAMINADVGLITIDGVVPANALGLPLKRTAGHAEEHLNFYQTAGQFFGATIPGAINKRLDGQKLGSLRGG